jgi:hypothetical protein
MFGRRRENNIKIIERKASGRAVCEVRSLDAGSREDMYEYMFFVQCFYIKTLRLNSLLTTNCISIKMWEK